MEKHYIKAQQLLEDSFNLAWQIYESGYRPNYIVGVWRGGALIGSADEIRQYKPELAQLIEKMAPIIAKKRLIIYSLQIGFGDENCFRLKTCT